MDMFRKVVYPPKRFDDYDFESLKMRYPSLDSSWIVDYDAVVRAQAYPKRPRRKFTVEQAIVTLGMFEVALGVTCFGLGIYAIVFICENEKVTSIGEGIWCSVFMMMGGASGVKLLFCKTKADEIEATIKHLPYSILSAMFAAVLVIVEYFMMHMHGIRTKRYNEHYYGVLIAVMASAGFCMLFHIFSAGICLHLNKLRDKKESPMFCPNNINNMIPSARPRQHTLRPPNRMKSVPGMPAFIREYCQPAPSCGMQRNVNTSTPFPSAKPFPPHIMREMNAAKCKSQLIRLGAIDSKPDTTVNFPPFVMDDIVVQAKAQDVEFAKKNKRKWRKKSNSKNSKLCKTPHMETLCDFFKVQSSVPLPTITQSNYE